MHTDKNLLKIDLLGVSIATIGAFTCLNCGYTELFLDYNGFENLQRNGRRYTR